MNKLEKQAAGYLYRPETSYVCGECVFPKYLKGGASGCALFGPSETVSLSKGSCNFFAHGKPHTDQPWLGVYTKLELGYTENTNGFSCKRCEEFSPERNDCKKVDKDSDGDTPGTISPNACCSNWERDPDRGNKTDEQLLKILSSSAVSARVPKYGSSKAI